MSDSQNKMSTLAKRIRKARTDRGWSQKALCERIGTHIPTLSQWENGKVIPTPHSLARIAGALQVPILQLVGDLAEIGQLGFGARLKALRHARGMRLRDLSEAMDVSHVTISLWENEAVEPKARQVGLLASTLNVTCDFIIFGSSKPQ